MTDERREAAAVIVQAVMNWGKAAPAAPLIDRPSTDPVNRRSARPQKPPRA